MKKTEYTSINCKKQTVRAFQAFCRDRGFSTGRALEMAMNRWMSEGCNKDIKEFGEARE